MKFRCNGNVCVGCCFDPCDYIYDEEKGDIENNIKPNTKVSQLKDDYYCPYCGAGSDKLTPLEK